MPNPTAKPESGLLKKSLEVLKKERDDLLNTTMQDLDGGLQELITLLTASDPADKAAPAAPPSPSSAKPTAVPIKRGKPKPVEEPADDDEDPSVMPSGKPISGSRSLEPKRHGIPVPIAAAAPARRPLPNYWIPGRSREVAGRTYVLPPGVKSSLPWLGHGLRGFLRKIWKGSSTDNPDMDSFYRNKGIPVESTNLSLQEYVNIRAEVDKLLWQHLIESELSPEHRKHIDEFRAAVVNKLRSSIEKMLKYQRVITAKRIGQMYRASKKFPDIASALDSEEPVTDMGGKPVNDEQYFLYNPVSKKWWSDANGWVSNFEIATAHDEQEKEEIGDKGTSGKWMTKAQAEQQYKDDNPDDSFIGGDDDGGTPPTPPAPENGGDSAAEELEDSEDLSSPEESPVVEPEDEKDEPPESEPEHCVKCGKILDDNNHTQGSNWCDSCTFGVDPEHDKEPEDKKPEEDKKDDTAHLNYKSPECPHCGSSDVQKEQGPIGEDDKDFGACKACGFHWTEPNVEFDWGDEEEKEDEDEPETKECDNCGFNFKNYDLHHYHGRWLCPGCLEGEKDDDVDAADAEDEDEDDYEPKEEQHTYYCPQCHDYWSSPHEYGDNVEHICPECEKKGPPSDDDADAAEPDDEESDTGTDDNVIYGKKQKECPECHSADISGKDSEEGFNLDDMTCKECGHQWTQPKVDPDGEEYDSDEETDLPSDDEINATFDNEDDEDLDDEDDEYQGGDDDDTDSKMMHCDKCNTPTSVDELDHPTNGDEEDYDQWWCPSCISEKVKQDLASGPKGEPGEVGVEEPEWKACSKCGDEYDPQYDPHNTGKCPSCQDFSAHDDFTEPEDKPNPEPSEPTPEEAICKKCGKKFDPHWHKGWLHSMCQDCQNPMHEEEPEDSAKKAQDALDKVTGSSSPKPDETEEIKEPEAEAKPEEEQEAGEGFDPEIVKGVLKIIAMNGGAKKKKLKQKGLKLEDLEEFIKDMAFYYARKDFVSDPVKASNYFFHIIDQILKQENPKWSAAPDDWDLVGLYAKKAKMTREEACKKLEIQAPPTKHHKPYFSQDNWDMEEPEEPEEPKTESYDPEMTIAERIEFFKDKLKQGDYRFAEYLKARRMPLNERLISLKERMKAH